MPEAKARILVVFYSRDGWVEALAKAVSQGAREAAAEVRLRRVPDLVSPDVTSESSQLGGAQRKDAFRVRSSHAT